MRRIVFLLLLSTAQLKADGLGKVEISPIYVHLDLLLNHDTYKKLDTKGVRLDLGYYTEKGWYAKPTGTWTTAKDGELATAGVGIGRCIPIFCEKVILSPQIGVTWTHIEARTHHEIPQLQQWILFKERFRSWSPYLGLEVIYRIRQDLRLSGIVQYAWSWSNAVIRNEFATDKSKGDAQGANYAIMLEKDFNKWWSINVAGGYNESLSKEKDGVRARGIKVGVTRWW